MMAVWACRNVAFISQCCQGYQHHHPCTPGLPERHQTRARYIGRDLSWADWLALPDT